MTAEEILTEISGKLTQVLDKLDGLQELLQRGATWIATPMGEFGFFARITYGEFLLAVLLCGWAALWLVRKVTSLLSPGGWW